MSIFQFYKKQFEFQDDYNCYDGNSDMPVLSVKKRTISECAIDENNQSVCKPDTLDPQWILGDNFKDFTSLTNCHSKKVVFSVNINRFMSCIEDMLK